MAELDNGHDVQDSVDAPVPGPGKTVSLLLSRGRVQGGGAVPGREPIPVPEPVDITDIGEKSCGAGGSDAVQVHQGGSAVGDQLPQFGVRGLDLAVDALEVRRSTRPSAAWRVLPTGSRGLIVATSARACIADRNFGSTREKLEQQSVQAVDCLSAGPAEFVASVREHAQHHQLRVGLDSSKIG